MRSMLPLSGPCYQEVTIQPDQLNQEPQARPVDVLHADGFQQAQALCRQDETTLSHEAWGAQLLRVNEPLADEDGNFAAIVQLVQRQDDLGNIAKSVLEISGNGARNSHLEHQLRLYNATNEEEAELHNTDLMSVPPLQGLPPFKRTQSPLWYTQKNFKLEDVRIDEDDRIIDKIVDNSSFANSKQQQMRKTLPHKKRISKKLKKNAPQNSDLMNDQDIEEESHQEMMMEHRAAHNSSDQNEAHIVDPSSHSQRQIFICQICEDFYEENQFKFYLHLRNHYESQIMMLDSMQHDAIDKIDDSIVGGNESLDALLVGKLTEYNEKFDNALKAPSIYDKNNLHADSSKFNFVGGNSIDKAWFACTQCPKTFKRQKQCEIHMRDSHSKTEEMSEFSDPEDLMEGINVVVEGDNEEFLQDDLSSQHSNTIVHNSVDNPQEQYILPHLTLDNAQVVDESSIKDWFEKENISENVKNSTNSTVNVEADENTLLADNGRKVKSELKPDNLIACSMCEGVLTSPKEYDLHVMECHMDLKGVPEMQNMINEEIEVSDVEENEKKENFSEVEVDGNSNEAEMVEENTNVSKKKEKTPLKCLVCGREFKHKNSIVYHMLSHNGTKSYQCEVCKKSFYTASAIKVHSRLHSGDKPYKCVDCGRMFRQWGDLKYHYVSIHSDIKQHQCEYCGKNFARKYSLIIHRRIHTGEKNYKCEFCDKTFRASSYLQTHRKIHTGEKPYPCEHCGKKFRMKGDMRRHLRTHRNVVVDKQKNCDVKPIKVPTIETENNAANIKSRIQTSVNVDSENLKIEIDSNIEFEDSSSDVKNSSTEEVSSSPNASNSQPVNSLGSNFPNEMFIWPVYIS